MIRQLEARPLLLTAALAGGLLGIAGIATTGCAPERAASAPTEETVETVETDDSDAPAALPAPLDTGADARRDRTLGDGAFEVSFGDQGGFDETVDEAMVEIAEPGIVALEADDWYVRVSGAGEPTPGEGGTDTFDSLHSLDTTISLEVAKGDGMVKVNCYPADPPRGTLRRTELTDTHLSGSFEVEIVRCDGFSGQQIDFPEEPFTVTGRYRRLPRTDNPS